MLSRKFTQRLKLSVKNEGNFDGTFFTEKRARGSLGLDIKSTSIHRCKRSSDECRWMKVSEMLTKSVLIERRFQLNFQLKPSAEKTWRYLSEFGFKQKNLTTKYVPKTGCWISLSRAEKWNRLIKWNKHRSSIDDRQFWRCRRNRLWNGGVKMSTSERWDSKIKRFQFSIQKLRKVFFTIERS